MKNRMRRILSFVLVISLLITSNISAFAIEEEYLSELRLIYADSYNEAKAILSGTEFKDYTVVNENLNEGTKKTGVWIAYQTTTDIEDAITDLSVMQMDGGYQLGNYQEMIEESFEEYNQVSKTYMQAIDYFVEAYDAGDFLAEAAYRQLNLYTAITDEDLGIKIPDYDGELLGDIFYDGIETNELATIFMQGNVHILQNIRSLLAMGVSYNEDGTHYLERVEEAAKSGVDVEDEEEYDELALLISGTLLTIQDMLKELSAYESEMDFLDDQITDLELQYSEHQSFADRMREVDYLDGQTLYDFCLSYELDKGDLSDLYPLVAALNDGQIAMTKVLHYYDVVRYSMSDYPEDVLDEMIAEEEELYEDLPFNVYLGVDRSIYYGSFALTSEAYRADAYTSDGFLSHMFADQTVLTVSMLGSFTAGTALTIWAIRRTASAKQSAQQAATDLANTKQALYNTGRYLKDNVHAHAGSSVGANPASDLGTAATGYGKTYSEVLDKLLLKYGYKESATYNSFNVKLGYLCRKQAELNSDDLGLLQKMDAQYNQMVSANHQLADSKLAEAQNMTTTVNSSVSGLTVAIYIVGGLMLLYSAFSFGLIVYNYYNPDYEDIPLGMVDLIETIDGDRYIKYDVVLEAEEKKNGTYAAGDLNAFAAQRWNALYYTKSYEAGKPLLADEFSLSSTNNAPKSGYAPIHRFGEQVCYDLNRYNFNDNHSIYLSVKQSKNNKSAVADVPKVVGSILSNGTFLLFGGLGALVGIGGTLATQSFLKKKKESTEGEEN